MNFFTNSIYTLLFLNFLITNTVFSQNIQNYKYTKDTICNRQLDSTQIINTEMSKNENINKSNLRSESTGSQSNTNVIKLCKPKNITIESANVWEQCSGNSINKECINSKCIIFSKYYGQCLPDKLEKNSLCGQNDNFEINWMHDVCDINLKCTKLENSMDYRCI